MKSFPPCLCASVVIIPRENDQIVIDKRYCGPKGSGNGGYVCGLLAQHIPASLVMLVTRLVVKVPPQAPAV